jgi:hypothetical protein
VKRNLDMAGLREAQPSAGGAAGAPRQPKPKLLLVSALKSLLLLAAVAQLPPVQAPATATEMFGVPMPASTASTSSGPSARRSRALGAPQAPRGASRTLRRCRRPRALPLAAWRQTRAL